MFLYANILGKWTPIDPKDEIDGIKVEEFYTELMAGNRIKEFYLIKFKNAPSGKPQQILVHKSCIQLV